MKILGIRTSPTDVRYAILEWNDPTVNLVNANGENRLVFPANIQSAEQKLRWFYQELEGISRKHPTLEKIVIKSNEFTGSESQSKRMSAYLDGVILLFADQNGLEVKTKLYNSIGTRSSDVKRDAESVVGPTTSRWDNKMADAVMAAWSERA